jgi:hypothetical protein
MATLDWPTDAPKQTVAIICQPTDRKARMELAVRASICVDPSANSDTQGRPETYAYIGPVIVPMISARVPILPIVLMPILPIMNLSQIAVACRIDLYRRKLWHGLAWRWHNKNDTSRNGRGHGQCFDAEHDKILLFY